MAYRKGTLRSMSPVTRKVARLIGEQDSIARRLKNLIPELQSLETDSRALATMGKSLGFSQEEWQDIRIGLDIVLRTEYAPGHPLHLSLSPYLYSMLRQLVDKLR